MAIRRAQDQVLLDNQGGDPEIVRGYANALVPELKMQLGMVMCRLLIGQQDRHPWAGQKPLQVGRVAGLSVACGETGAQFAQHDDGHGNGMFGADDPNPVAVAAHEIAVSVGIERDVHFHASSSTRSKSAMARSNSGSSCHVPIPSPAL